LVPKKGLLLTREGLGFPNKKEGFGEGFVGIIPLGLDFWNRQRALSSNSWRTIGFFGMVFL